VRIGAATVPRRTVKTKEFATNTIGNFAFELRNLIEARCFAHAASA
jgi:hypothetical protein